MPTKRSTFIGIDLSDHFAKRKRPCTRATIGTDLNCIFDEWEYDLTGNQIIPDKISPAQFVLAIDGPQGLAGNPGRTIRLGERKLTTAGKSPYAFRPIGQNRVDFFSGEPNAVKDFLGIITDNGRGGTVVSLPGHDSVGQGNLGRHFDTFTCQASLQFHEAMHHFLKRNGSPDACTAHENRVCPCPARNGRNQGVGFIFG